MRNSAVSNRTKSIVVLILGVVGVILGLLSYLNPALLIPTNSWLANMLVPLAIGGIAYLVITFARYMAGREKGAFTMRQMGRLMLHLGLIVLLLGVFMSSNIEYESTDEYLWNGSKNEIAPGLELQIINMQVDHTHLYVTVQLLQDNQSIGVGTAYLTVFEEWRQTTSTAYIHTTAGRDVFIAISFYDGTPGLVTLSVKVLQLVSFVWLGTFFMIAAIVPLFILELNQLRNAIKSKEEHLYEEDSDTIYSDESIGRGDS
jgi:cytochrome c biogenesis factor